MAQSAIGLKIRDRRLKLGISQTELAQRLGISASYLNLIERNKRNIAARLLNGLADHLGVDIEWLDGEAERRLVQEIQELATDPNLNWLKALLRIWSPAARNGQRPWLRCIVPISIAMKRLPPCQIA